jgi:protoporphyrinogen oxidase
MEYDEIIIGAGMAGLYWVYKTRPTNFLILEKLDRIGGRVWNKMWNGHQISLGGGVIKASNILTINLAKDLALELGSSISKYYMVDFSTHSGSVHSRSNNISDNISDNISANELDKIPNEEEFYKSNLIITKYLKKIYKANKQEIQDKKLTWDEFLDLYLSVNVAKTIKSNLLYQTYSNADPYSVLYLEIDELLRTKEFEIKYIKDLGYTRLLEKLVGIVGRQNIRTNTTVTKITKQNEIYKIYLGDEQFVKAKKIIVATPVINGIQFDLPIGVSDNITKLYGMVGGSKYIRIYSYHSKKHGLKYSYRTTGLPGKVILINEYILMCSYTEEIPATRLYELLSKNTKEAQLEIIHDLLKNCGINVTKPDDIIIKLWDIGVHFNKPGYSQENKYKLLADLKNHGIIIIGEAVGDTHGWVNSAFESVETIILL